MNVSIHPRICFDQWWSAKLIGE